MAQWWGGFVGGDLCGGFWLIWIFRGGCSWLASCSWLGVVVDCAIDRFVVFFFFFFL